MSSTMIAAGKRIAGVEQRVSHTTSRGTPTYTVTSSRPLALLMRYEGDADRVDMPPVFYDGQFVGVFILWCDATVTAYDTLTGEELGRWHGASVRQKEVA